MYSLQLWLLGGLQVLIGLFKLGRIAEIFPSTVIHGILASIGIIIFAKQMHVAMGTSSDAENTVGILARHFSENPRNKSFYRINLRNRNNLTAFSMLESAIKSFTLSRHPFGF